MFDLANFAPPLLNEVQYNMTAWLANLITNHRLKGMLGTLKGDALTSKYSLDAFTQGELSNTQWQTDVIRWFSIMQSSMQSATVDFATGPADQRMAQWVFYAGPVNDQERYFAHNQVSLYSYQQSALTKR